LRRRDDEALELVRRGAARQRRERCGERAGAVRERGALDARVEVGAQLELVGSREAAVL
jgi:hypothetical protein